MPLLEGHKFSYCRRCTRCGITLEEAYDGKACIPMMPMPYRCTECTLLRLAVQGYVCDECLENIESTEKLKDLTESSLEECILKAYNHLKDSF